MSRSQKRPANDIHRNNSGSYSLLYAAGPRQLSDPYIYEWTWDGQKHSGKNKALQTTPELHEEFFMFAPSGKKVAWMKGPIFWGRYLADLYVSNPDFTEIERVTWYNDCKVWPDRCKPDGCQLSRLTWNNDGTAIFLGSGSMAGVFGPTKRQSCIGLTLAGIVSRQTDGKSNLDKLRALF